MLEFQLAMLADDSLSGPAFDAIGAGATADEAWSDALAGRSPATKRRTTNISARAPPT